MTLVRQCRFCGADILFLTSTETKKPIPIDAKSTTVFAITESGEARPIKGVHLNHWVTCAQREAAAKARDAKKKARSR